MVKTVLLVDDSELILEINRYTLEAVGFQVFTALSGFAALEILGSNSIDLAIVDINMPGMDGDTLIRKIRRDPVFGEIPIIIITTETEARDKKKGFEAGANAYIIKPIPPDELVTNIKMLLGDTP